MQVAPPREHSVWRSHQPKLTGGPLASPDPRRPPSAPKPSGALHPCPGRPVSQAPGAATLPSTWSDLRLGQFQQGRGGGGGSSAPQPQGRVPAPVEGAALGGTWSPGSWEASPRRGRRCRAGSTAGPRVLVRPCKQSPRRSARTWTAAQRTQRCARPPASLWERGHGQGCGLRTSEDTWAAGGPGVTAAAGEDR